MSSDGVEDVECVADGADMDSGEGGLLIHWKEEWKGVVGGNGRITDSPLFLNEFRVFRCVLMARERKEAITMEIPVIVELIYFAIFRGARALEGGDQTICCL